MIESIDRQDSSKTSRNRHWDTQIKILGSLRITEKYTSNENWTTKPGIPEIMSIVSALALAVLEQAVTLKSVICQVYLSRKYISMVILLSQLLLYKPVFHDGHLSCNMSLWWWCNLLDILSSMMGILLSDSVSYSRVLTPVSVSLLEPSLRVIGAIPLKLQASPIVLPCI